MTQRELDRKAARERKAERDKEILRLRNKGLTQQEIAEQVGCSLRTVKSKTRVDKTERDRRIKELRKEGLSLRKIAKKINCSVNTVVKVIAE